MIQAVTGGGFGGKEEYPNVICAHAGLLARKAGRPVKIIYDRHEDMAATTKRHPAVDPPSARVRRATARLVAQDVEILMDGGAYVTLSPVVLSRGHAARHRSLRLPERPHPLARGDDEHAAERGVPRLRRAADAVRRRDADRARSRRSSGSTRSRSGAGTRSASGSTLPMGQTLRESVGARQALEACVEAQRLRAAHARVRALEPRGPSRPSWRGIGLALVHHGAGFTGSGEAVPEAAARP